MIDIREYNERGGRSPFREWYDGLNSDAARKVTTALYRVGLGNFANAKTVGAGVYECKINFGPGYRVYFGKEGEQTVILLGGGTKQRQQNDIKLALERGVNMALTRDFRETVQARVKRDAAFRKGLLSEAIESLLFGEVTLGKELLRDYINATVGFPKLASHTKIHVKTLHQMFGPNGNPTAKNLFEIIAYLQHAEGVRFEVRSTRAALRTKRRPLSQGNARFLRP